MMILIGAWSNPIKPKDLNTLLPKSSPHDIHRTIPYYLYLSYFKQHFNHYFFFHVSHDLYYYAAQPIPFWTIGLKIDL